MAFRAYLNRPYNHTHENELFDTLVAKLNSRFQDSDDLFILLGNVCCNGRDMDAIVIKQNSITVIDFKNYGGEIKFSENTRWTADGILVKGGSHLNPLEQLKENKRLLKGYLEYKDSIFRNDGSVFLPHISGIVLFHQPISFDISCLPPNIKAWFRLSDIDNVADVLYRFSSPNIKLSDEEILSIPVSFDLNEYGIDTTVHSESPHNDYKEITSVYSDNDNLLNQKIKAATLIGHGKQDYDRGRYKSAIQYFRLAQQINDAYAEAYYYCGLCELELFDYKASIKSFDKYLSLEHDDAYAYLKRGFAKEQFCQYSEAIKDYTFATQYNRNLEEAYLQKGICYLVLEQYSEAEAECSKAIDLNASNAPAYFNRAVSKLQQQQILEAIEDLKQAILINTDFREAIEKLEIVQHEHTECVALENYANGLMYLSFNTSEATTAFSKAIDLKRNYKEAYSARAYTSLLMSDPNLALEDCTKALEQDPEYSLAFFLRGEANYSLRDYSSAKSDFLNAMHHFLSEDIDETFNFDWTNIMFKIGICCQRLNEHEDSISFFNSTIENSTENSRIEKLNEAYERRGVSYLAVKDYKCAKKDFNKVLKEKASYETPVFFNRGICHKNLGKLKSAIKDFSSHIKSNPNDAVAFFERGLCIKILVEVGLDSNDEYCKEDFERAIMDFTKAIELDENYALAYFNRYDCYQIRWCADGVFFIDEQQEKDLKKAHELDKNNPVFLNALKQFYAGLFGCALSYTTEYNSILDDSNLHTIIELINELAEDHYCHNSSQIYLVRGWSHANLGSIDCALEDFEQAVKYCETQPEHFLHDRSFYVNVDRDNYPLEHNFQRQAYFNKGVCNEILKNYDQAVKDYAKASKLPLNEENLWLEINLNVCKSYKTPRTPERLYQAGRCKEAQEDFEEAASYFSEAAGKNPVYLSYLNNHFQCFIVDKEASFIGFESIGYKYKGQNNKAAVLAFDFALLINPTDADCFYQRAICKIALKDYVGSIDDFTKAIQLNYMLEHEAYIGRAEAKAGLKRYYDAVADYSFSLEIGSNPEEVIALERRAKYKKIIGDFVGAKIDLVESERLKVIYKDSATYWNEEASLRKELLI